MPLVVPGITSESGGDKKSSWMNKLAGKKLSDSHTETSFAKKDLPQEHRIVEEGAMLTQDFKPDRQVLPSFPPSQRSRADSI